MEDKKVLPYSSEDKKIARFAKALAHPARVRILTILSERSSCFSTNIADEFPIALSTLSQHLKELKSAGLIKGNIEPPRIRYCIESENWDEAARMFGLFFRLPQQSAEDKSGRVAPPHAAEKLKSLPGSDEAGRVV